MVNFVFMKKKFVVEINKDDSYETLIMKLFSKITKTNTDKFIQQESIVKRFNEHYYLTYITHIITEPKWNGIKKIINTNDFIFINFRLNGGLELNPFKMVINAIFNLLRPIANPLHTMAETFEEALYLIGDLLELMSYIFLMIPVVFDPPRLVNDILYAITTSITLVIDRLMNSVSFDSPDDGDKEESGPMGLNKREKEKVCIPPTLVHVIFLILCPPLAIFFKYDFFTAIIPVIICGVLCVKLYYFPGLLFATLMTLC